VPSFQNFTLSVAAQTCSSNQSIYVRSPSCQQGLDKSCYMRYTLGMKESKARPNTSVRVDREVLHQARVSAVTAKKTLGHWLEEAIQEKIEREQKG